MNKHYKSYSSGPGLMKKKKNTWNMDWNLNKFKEDKFAFNLIKSVFFFKEDSNSQCATSIKGALKF